MITGELASVLLKDNHTRGATRSKEQPLSLFVSKTDFQPKNVSVKTLGFLKLSYWNRDLVKTSDQHRRLQRRGHARATLGLNHPQGMSVRIPDQQPLREPERPVCQSHHSRRKRVARAATNRSRHRLGIVADQTRLPVREIIGAGIGGHRPPVSWGQIFEELDAGTRGRPERRDAQARAKDIVQAFLLGPVILTLTSHSKAD